MIPHPPHGVTASSLPGPPQCRGFKITLRHTTLDSTPLDELSARRRNLFLSTHNSHKRQTSMRTPGFEPAIAASVRSQAYALDRVVNGIGEDTIWPALFPGSSNANNACNNCRRRFHS